MAPSCRNLIFIRRAVLEVHQERLDRLSAATDLTDMDRIHLEGTLRMVEDTLKTLDKWITDDPDLENNLLLAPLRRDLTRLRIEVLKMLEGRCCYDILGRPRTET